MAKIAIIGSGISGISASWFLKNEHNITLFEKQNRFGGHANTSTINYNGNTINVDTGFIVFNYKTYHHLQRLFSDLEVSVEKSKMSFGVSNNEIEYSSVAPFANFNFIKKDYIKMLFEIVKFNSIATKNDVDGDISLNEFLDTYNFSQYFRRNYIYAMAGSIWSCDIETSKLYPAKSFIDFFKNHGLLRVINHPQWYCVKGGSKNYVQKVLQDLEKHNAKIIKSNVLKVLKDGNKVKVLHQKIDLQNDQNNSISEDTFDKVIVATHADEAYQITSNEVLIGFRYSKNLAVLHKDESLMPQNKTTWASWNYVSNFQNDLSLTYWMNNLQNIDNSYPLFVTLNPAKQIKQSDIFYQTIYNHPIFDFKSRDIVKKINSTQGNDGIYYLGSYLGYGFHEDGILSAYEVCKNLVSKMPW